jgi:hypothetical protein
MFAAGLAAAGQPGEYRDQLPASLVAACEQAVSPAPPSRGDDRKQKAVPALLANGLDSRAVDAWRG